MEIITLDTAKELVKQNFSKAQDPQLTYLLNLYAGKLNALIYYRPFIVAAILMKSEYKRLIKADIATWEYNKDAYLSLLDLQRIMDNQIINDGGLIDYSISVDNMDECLENAIPTDNFKSIGFIII